VIEKILPGKGKYAGKMGSLLCKTKDGAMVKIGSGFFYFNIFIGL
jgi:ATP-dependent DNA ligase